MLARTSALFVLIGLALSSLFAADDYPLGPDSKTQPDVPNGEVLQFKFDQSKIFPGTTRNYSIYIPKQYDPAKPACLFVDQDGVQFNSPIVFDNLIARGEMPVTIGVFITPGVLPAPNDQALPRYNRSLEYDGLGDAYARFLLEELLPDAEKKTASDGRPIHFSKNAADRAIAGASSGGICAFTVAWERPDAFQRVFSCVGTYVDLRGGNDYPSLVRKYEPKPLRVFLEDGSADQNIYGGDWWMANQELERALVFAGYEVNHAWGEGGHNAKHATAIFPDAMRWLWKDWPQSVKAGVSKNNFLNQVLIPGEDWQLVSEGYKFTEGPAANPQGEVFFNDVPDSKTYKIDLDGKVTEFLPATQRTDGEAFGPNGNLYAVSYAAEKVFTYPPGKTEPVEVAGGFRGKNLVVRHDGLIYMTEPGWDGTKPSNVWLIKPNGEKQIVDTGLKFANGVTLSPDQTLLYVDDTKSHWVYSYRIQPDGTLADKERYFWLHLPDAADDAGAGGMRCDRLGNLYVATRLGIQVCDQAGRVNFILPTPNGHVANFTFGGKDFDTLYAACRDKIYRRKLRVQAANAWQPPIKPPAPHL